MPNYRDAYIANRKRNFQRGTQVSDEVLRCANLIIEGDTNLVEIPVDVEQDKMLSLQMSIRQYLQRRGHTVSLSANQNTIYGRLVRKHE